MGNLINAVCGARTAKKLEAGRTPHVNSEITELPPSMAIIITLMMTRRLRVEAGADSLVLSRFHIRARFASAAAASLVAVALSTTSLSFFRVSAAAAAAAAAAPAEAGVASAAAAARPLLS